MQGFHASAQHPRCPRINHAAQKRAVGFHSTHQFLVPAGRSRDEVTVASQVFGRRIQKQVHPQFQRTLENGAEVRVVDIGPHWMFLGAMPMGKFHRRPHPMQLHRWVSRGLHVDHTRYFIPFSRLGFELIQTFKFAHGDSHGGENFPNEMLCSSIEWRTKPKGSIWTRSR